MPLLFAQQRSNDMGLTYLAPGFEMSLSQSASAKMMEVEKRNEGPKLWW